ncbi:6-pyruvoyl trahydropterin synthase family protein [Rothia halotolerans]|uniref:6-pyruvoyl trahydropterin synthase family protein n=1 Tax=Rothia halotolerans TaxID=405770 RepID=UPI00101C2DAC|nr:6-carboxytetrahydropterin synthase [Rothia halotolerans]
MFRLTVRNHIMIAHTLPEAFFGPAQGMHGATLEVEATWRRRELGPHSVVMDIGAATEMLDAALEPLRYRNLDEHPAFHGRLSTTEAIAEHIGRDLAGRFDTSDFSGLEIVIRENPDAWVAYDLPFE